MVVRDAAKGAAIEAKWGVKTYRDIDSLSKKSGYLLWWSWVPSEAPKGSSRSLRQRAFPILMETASGMDD
jgi:hypothetical protein